MILKMESHHFRSIYLPNRRDHLLTPIKLCPKTFKPFLPLKKSSIQTFAPDNAASEIKILPLNMMKTKKNIYIKKELPNLNGNRYIRRQTILFLEICVPSGGNLFPTKK